VETGDVGRDERAVGREAREEARVRNEDAQERDRPHRVEQREAASPRGHAAATVARSPAGAGLRTRAQAASSVTAASHALRTSGATRKRVDPYVVAATSVTSTTGASRIRSGWPRRRSSTQPITASGASRYKTSTAACCAWRSRSAIAASKCA